MLYNNIAISDNMMMTIVYTDVLSDKCFILKIVCLGEVYYILLFDNIISTFSNNTML
jgi:hypothetical protein